MRWLLPKRAEALPSRHASFGQRCLQLLHHVSIANNQTPGPLQLAAGGAILSSVLTLHDGEDGQAVLRGAGLVGWRRARLLGRRKDARRPAKVGQGHHPRALLVCCLQH